MASINLKQLEAFVQVADLGSFRRAASRLNTTQPNISARIATLEGQLGVVLMQRDAGSVRLTPKGDLLLTKARKVLRATEEFIEAAGDEALFDGMLRLGVTEMIVHSWLGTYLRALKDRFPNVLIDLTVDLSANLSPALFDRAIDLTLQSGPFSRQISGLVDLGSYPMIWVASPSLGLGGRPLSLADISAHPVLTHARGTLPYDQLSEHIAFATTSASGTRVRLVPSTNMAACLQMTVDGLGIACLPAAMVQRELCAGLLEPLHYPWLPDELSFAARYDVDTAPSYMGQVALIARDIAGDFAARTIAG